VNTRANHKNECADRNLSFTLEFSPVVTRLDEQKPFKRLPRSACANTRLNPGVNEK
jgi:hypothetical protein